MNKCIWFTGLCCSGKTTIAEQLISHYPNAVHLDGDVIRGTPLAKDVGFSPEDRKKHILRMGQIAKMLVDAGATVICSFVSPQRSVREEVRHMFNVGEFFEVFVDTPLDECIKRDVKGMYKKALAGEIKNFTGIQAKYEVPVNPELIIETKDQTIDESVSEVLEWTNPYSKPHAVYIGRWNGVFHNGHDYIIQKSLNEGKNVLMLVRNVEPDDKNPWTASEVKEMLDFRFKNEARVKIQIIPDVGSVEYGRGVGYEVNEIKVDKVIAGVSGTACRKMIAEGDNSWMDCVPVDVLPFLKEKYNVIDNENKVDVSLIIKKGEDFEIGVEK